MILEGLVTTIDAAGAPHVAPMGPIVDADCSLLVFRPFPTSTTGANLLRSGAGVFHLTDDARQIAFAALGKLVPLPVMIPATAVRGSIIEDCCRAFEFEATSIDTAGERYRIEARVLVRHTFRDFLGFHRAKHAVLEAAILATRFHILDLAVVATEFRKLRTIVDKTGGEAERDAMDFLEGELASQRGAMR